MKDKNKMRIEICTFWNLYWLTWEDIGFETAVTFGKY